MKALIVWGGWDGHTPKETAAIKAAKLESIGFRVRVEDSLSALEDLRALKRLDLIVPCWTCGELTPEQYQGINKAVLSGVGLGGTHGGMGDAFRSNIEYQWMCGGQFVGHPHTGDYFVRLTDAKSPITKGMKRRFKYCSEQYYMLVDPGVRILADSIYVYEGKKATMPVVWTKAWGKGRVFYSALGHCAQEFVDYPEVLEMTARGMLWAAQGKAAAKKNAK